MTFKDMIFEHKEKSYKVIEPYQPFMIKNSFEAKVLFSQLENEYNIQRLSETYKQILYSDDVEHKMLSFYFFQKAIHTKYPFGHNNDFDTFLNNSLNNFVIFFNDYFIFNGKNIQPGFSVKTLMEQLKNDDSTIKRVLLLRNAEEKISSLAFYFYFATNDEDSKDKLKSQILKTTNDDIKLTIFNELSKELKEKFFEEAKEHFRNKYLTSCLDK